MILYGQTFGDGGKEELAFNRKKPVRASFRERQPSAITGWGKNGGRAYEKNIGVEKKYSLYNVKPIAA